MPDDLQAAFAYDLASPAILHFIGQLANLPSRDQKSVFDAAADAAASPQERDVEAALAKTCPNLDDIYGSSRAFYLVVNEWTLGELNDQNRSDGFSAAVRNAVSSLAAGNRLTAEERRIALAPFAALDAPPTPAPRASGSCPADASARTVHVAVPHYPPLAVSAGTMGTVYLKVRLTDMGDVRSVRLYGDTLHRRLGAHDIEQASILAAAETSYAPEIKNCRPIAGTYIFVADYGRK